MNKKHLWKKRLALILSTVLAVSIFTGCTAETEDSPVQSGDSKVSESTQTPHPNEPITEFDRSETVYLFSGMSTLPNSMNPLAGDTGFPVGTQHNILFLYETLFMMNMVTGELEPLIADSYEIIDDLTVQVKINPNVTFNDGQPCTSADIAYSYELGKRYDVMWSSFWQNLEKIEIIDGTTLIFHQNPSNANTLNILDALQSCPIMPKHIWEPIEQTTGNDLTKIRNEYTNLENPVGTGSYMLHSFNDQQTVIVRNENYWGVKRFGKLPTPKYIVNPHYSSNDALTLDFKNNEIDMAQAFIPQIWKLTEENPAIATYLDDFPYHLEGGMVAAMFNMSVPGLDNPEVRNTLIWMQSLITSIAIILIKPTKYSMHLVQFQAVTAYAFFLTAPA